MQQRIVPAQAMIGMYVCSFEGSWFKHPFWRAKFVIQAEDTLEQIRSSEINGLVIDTEKGIAAPATPEPASAPVAEDAPGIPDVAPETEQIVPIGKKPSTRLPDPEIDRARSILNQGKAMVMDLFNDARMGKLTVTQEVLELVDDIARSVERSHATLINMARLKSKDEYTYLHSVAVCALMINFARQLGMAETQVHELGVAGLLHDVGKMTIPPEILNKAGKLTDEEFATIKAHTLSGHDLLKMSDNIPRIALDVALHHHEKVDGSGYPFGLKGPDLSVAARMGAICDIYDALTSDRCYKEAWTPTEAITRMNSWKGHLDPDLLFAFQQSVAIFPPEQLVRLRSNRLAVILPNGRRGSRAKARAFFDARERVFLPPEDVMLKDGMNGDQVISREEPSHWPFPDWVRLHTDLMEGKYRMPKPEKNQAA